MSSSAISSALFGFGLPPAAPMSPPAQFTRTLTTPSFASISLRILCTAVLSPMLPVTATVRVPYFSSDLATAPRSGASLYLLGAFQSMSWIATSAPNSHRRSAMVRPSPRPDPVTNIVLPLNSLLISISSVHQAYALHVGRAAPDHVEFIADQRRTVSVALPRRAIVLEMCVAHARGYATGEVQRRLCDRESVAGVETNSYVVPCLGAEIQQLAAAEILVILDRDRYARTRRLAREVVQLGAYRGDQRRPLFALRRAVAAQHRGQRRADDFRIERNRRTDRTFVGLPRQTVADDGLQAEAGQTFAQRAQLGVGHRREPRIVNLDRLRTDLLRDTDQTFESASVRVGARAVGALQAEVVGQAVGIQAGSEHGGPFGRWRMWWHQFGSFHILVVEKCSSGSRCP